LLATRLLAQVAHTLIYKQLQLYAFKIKSVKEFDLESNAVTGAFQM
jgi:N-acetyl-anhydromuramyl-L-alanine amidase AmpD